MKAATAKDVLELLFMDYTPLELSKMTPTDVIDIANEIEDEVNSIRQQEEQDIEIYGDPDEDEYSMSDSHRADCEAEKWEWLKDA